MCELIDEYGLIFEWVMYYVMYAHKCGQIGGWMDGFSRWIYRQMIYDPLGICMYVCLDGWIYG